MFELTIDIKDNYITKGDFNKDLSVVTQNSTQLIEKMELSDFNLISGPNDSTRVTENSRKTINLAFASFQCTSKINEYALTDHYGVEIDFNIGLIKNAKSKIFTVEILEKCKSRNSKFNSNNFYMSKLSLKIVQLVLMKKNEFFLQHNTLDAM